MRVRLQFVFALGTKSDAVFYLIVLLAVDTVE